MKYLFLGLLLLAVLLAFCLWLGTDVSRRLGAVIAPVEQAVRKAETGNLSAARERVAAAGRIWSKHREALAASMDHNAVDAVSLSFAALSEAADEDVLPQCRTLLLVLQNLRQSDHLTVENLL